MRRVRRKGGNKEKVFGCDLLEHLTASSQGIPLVLRCCSEFVEQHGVVDGIYRLSGVSSNIQKLRSEFESEGSPDLNKDLYLQDIHCVSSLCKAYFRELPNPLLTYQLYDKFAEAVAIQLEEERLVKINDVLKELPAPHYRTLEFLMRHLVKMASYSSETNMHARNLAIVWAPNLLRSKDIEASGFNGTAAFMEVRVQSIVVEFILTHVPQLFPEQGVSSERRKSLPSPSAMSSQEDVFFRCAQPNFGNISPGDGPLPIRPYHAIIEGTDKRKGSLKGRKWMSIFNIGGRIQDQRRRHKHSTKEKDRTSLRPARSMDSLSTPPFPNEGTRRSGQHPPSINMSPLVTPSVQPGSDTAAPSGGLGSSEYAVTYRRGTGLVSGSTGTPGTYTALDPEGLGLPVNEGVQTRSPGLSSKASRRAAMHITGPTLVTVPLHITSNLALGVLQGGGSDRIILRGRDKDGGEKVEGKERGEKIERKEFSAMEWNVEESRKVEEEEKHQGEKEVVNVGGNKEVAGGLSGEKGEGAEEKRLEEVNDRVKQEPVLGVQDVSREQQATSIKSAAEEDRDEDAAEDDEESDSGEYMDMKGEKHRSAPQHGNDGVFDASHILNSTEVEEDDHELSGYVQDNFDFLDQMDCSVMEHIDISVPCQVNEFSVEPPGHSDDEYEIMKQVQPSHQPSQLSPDMYTQSQTELNPHRPLSLDLPSRHTKSLSLPYMTSPVHGPEESFSEGESSGDDIDDNIYDSEEDESMFIQSLPTDFFLNNLSELKPDTDTQDCSRDRSPVHELQSSEANKCPSLNLELSACKITMSGDQGQIEIDGGADEDESEEKQTIKKKDDDKAHHGSDQLENDVQRATQEHLSIMKDAQSEKSLTSDASETCCEEFPLQRNENNNEFNTVTGNNFEDVDEMGEIPPGDSPPQVASYDTLKESADAPSEESNDTSVIPAQHPRGCVREDTAEREDRSQQSVVEIEESDENMREELTKTECERIADKNHEGWTDEASLFCSNSDIWDELEDIVCEVIEDEESKKCEEEAVAAQLHLVEDEPNKTDIRVEEEEELLDKTVGKLGDPVMQQEKLDQKKHAFSEEAQHHSRGEVVSREKEENKQKADIQSRAQPSVDKLKELKGNQMRDNSDGSLGGFGRKLVTSKHPKVYQIKAVPVVPPKPQHCKITALTLRQQQQQRERRDADRGRETIPRALTEQDRVSSAEQLRDRDDESADRKERLVLLRERERRRDGAEGAARDTSRNSPLSMCFDEAVAIATMRREKERVREGDAEAEGLGK